MAIPIFNFVGITSGVGGNSQVPTRNYGALIVTGNPIAPTGSIITFQSAAAVGEYFGTGSEEYARAVFYFSWISKNITTPSLLSFWFWNNEAATGSLIYGIQGSYSTSQFTGITTGDLTLTLGGFTHHLTAINLSAAGSLAAVATDITAAINAYSAGGAAWTGAVVSFDATTGQFNLVSGATGTDVISVTAGSSEDLVGPLGWGVGATFSNGTAAQTLAANLAELIGISNNFGSFCTTFALALSLINTEEAANFNNSLTPNIQFLYSVNVTPANAAAWGPALDEIGGTTLTLQSPGAAAAIEFPEMLPMNIFAATNYNQPNSVQNYKYQQADLTPSVTSQAGYNTYTALNINFYGNTQTAGALINFYMNGYMMGISTDPQFQNLYANEIWFKDNLAAALLNLLLALPQVPANSLGRIQILSAMQPIINQALLNGTISIGKTLTETQILFISEVTGSQTAWQQVQTQGYWINVVIESSVVDNVTTYTAVYTLVYSKDDVVQSITGSNILI